MSPFGLSLTPAGRSPLGRPTALAQGNRLPSGPAGIHTDDPPDVTLPCSRLSLLALRQRPRDLRPATVVPRGQGQTRPRLPPRSALPPGATGLRLTRRAQVLRARHSPEFESPPAADGAGLSGGGGDRRRGGALRRGGAGEGAGLSRGDGDPWRGGVGAGAGLSEGRGSPRGGVGEGAGLSRGGGDPWRGGVGAGAGLSEGRGQCRGRGSAEARAGPPETAPWARDAGSWSVRGCVPASSCDDATGLQ